MRACAADRVAAATNATAVFSGAGDFSSLRVCAQQKKGKKLRLPLRLGRRRRRRLIDVVFSDKLVRSICYGTEQTPRPKDRPRCVAVAAREDERASKVCGIHYNLVRRL